MYHPQFGVVNSMLEKIGLESWTRAWLSDPKVNMFAVSVPIIWSYIGPYLIIFIAALQNISSEIYDAAHLDGAAGEKVVLRHIAHDLEYRKLLHGIVHFRKLKSVRQVMVMTGGAAQSTELLATYMYNNTFRVYRYGYGSAVSAMIMIVSALLIGINYVMNRGKRDN